MLTASGSRPDSLGTPGLVAGDAGWEDTRQLAPGKQDREAERTGVQGPASGMWLFPREIRSGLCALEPRPWLPGACTQEGKATEKSAQAQGFTQEAMPLLDLGPGSLDSRSLKNERCQHLSPERAARPDPGAWATWEQESPPPCRQLHPVLERWAPPGGHMEPNRNLSCDRLQALL